MEGQKRDGGNTAATRHAIVVRGETGLQPPAVH